MGFWNRKKVLVTGHTGFKGSWLSLWLKNSGAQVAGYALKPGSSPSMSELVNLKDGMLSVEGDIRDNESLGRTIQMFRPELVFHLAAQPLVRRSYKDPLYTFQTNIIGTSNLLNCLRSCGSIRVVINVTSDKCYENREWYWGYREDDRVGGFDPYSCSKACCELITDSFRKSFYDNLGILVSSVRAGNVIGGGDWSEDRLVPDVIRAFSRGEAPAIRNPQAVRPWQHVLEPLNGYMLLAEKMWNEGKEFAQAWNFGPEDEHTITVGDMVQRLAKLWGSKTEYICADHKLHEAQMLKLDCSKAKARLSWKGRLTMDETLEWTVEWYKAFERKYSMRDMTLKQINRYERLGEI